MLLDELESLSCSDAYALRRTLRRRGWASVAAYRPAGGGGPSSAGGGGGGGGAGGDRDEDSLLWNYLTAQDPSAPVDRRGFARVCALAQLQFRRRKVVDDQPFLQRCGVAQRTLAGREGGGAPPDVSS